MEKNTDNQMTLNEKVQDLQQKIQIGSEELKVLDQKILQTGETIKALDTETEEVKNQIQIKEENIKKIENKIDEIEKRLKALSERKENKQVESEIQILESPLSSEQIEKNKETVDSIFSKEEKAVITKEAGEKEYNDKTRETVLDETTKDEKREKVKKGLQKAIKIFRRGFWSLVGAGTITLVGSGFTKDKDGQVYYDYKTAIKPIVNTALSVLPDTQRGWAERAVFKWGLKDLPEDTVNYIDAKKTYEDKLQKEKNKKEHKEYLNNLTYFQKIDEVVDYRASNSEVTRKLMRYRSQWANENGFEYIAIPNRGNIQGENQTWKNVEGIGHFLLDSDISMNQKDKASYDMDPSPNRYLHSNSQGFIEIAKKNNHYIPVFQRVSGNLIRLKYKLPNEITSKDGIMSPLRQYKFDDIDFNHFKQPDGFTKSVKEVTLKHGVKNLYTGDNSTNLIFATENPKSYGQFSGCSVVFIFNDKKGNRIVRDFAGSINDIQKEGESIEREFKLPPHSLTLGVHDVGAFGGKPVADKNGELTVEQWKSFHPGSNTGGGLAIPKQEKIK